MATHLIVPDADPDADLDDFMKELDRDLKKAVVKPKAKLKVVVPDPVVVQVWFPHAATLVTNVQQCSCGQRHEAIEGLFTEDITRNGAIRRLRVGKEGMPTTHVKLPRRVETVLSSIDLCPSCFHAAVLNAAPGLGVDERLPSIDEQLSEALDNLL